MADERMAIKAAPEVKENDSMNAFIAMPSHIVNFNLTYCQLALGGDFIAINPSLNYFHAERNTFTRADFDHADLLGPDLLQVSRG